MTEKEMYNLINSQNNQESNGFAVNEKERGISGVFFCFDAQSVYMDDLSSPDYGRYCLWCG